MTTQEEYYTYVNSISKSQYRDYLAIHYSANTQKQYLWAFTKYAAKLYNQTQVNKFMIAKVFSTSNNPFYIGFLRSFIDCFGLHYIVPKSRRKISKRTHTQRFLTYDEIVHIIQYLPPYYSLVVQVYFDTGLRLRELFNTRWDDLDLPNRAIKGIGKNNRPYVVHFTELTQKRLKDYIEARIRAGLRYYPYIFHKDDSKTRHERHFQYKLKRLCAELGIENVHPHRIRHALGRHLRQGMGMDIDQIRIKLRHVKFDTTAIYTDTTPEEVEQSIDKVGLYG